MSPTFDPDSAADLFGAASNSTRLGILTHLAERAASGAELEDALLVARANLQKQLARLKDQGLISYDPEAKVYRIEDREAIARLHAAVPEILPAPPSVLEDDED